MKIRLFWYFLVVVFRVFSHESMPEAPLWVLKELYANLPPGISVKSYPGHGIGLSATSSVYSQRSCMCVPKSLLILPNDDFSLSEYISHLSDTQKLIVRTMYEKLNSTDFRVKNLFLQSLSSEFLHPGSFAKPHIKIFQSVNFNPVNVESFIEAESFTEIFKALEKVSGLDDEMLRYSSYIWASHHVNSKKIITKDSKGNDSIGFIPFIDLVSNYPKAGLGNKQSIIDLENEICVLCSWDSQPGELLTRDFGQFSTLQYFLTFGKVFENNPYDYLNITHKDQNFILKIEEINKDLLNILGNGVERLTNYRKILLKEWGSDKIGIRENRRKILPIQDLTVQKILKYGVEIRKTFYKHLKLLDQQALFEIFYKVF
jgi:hypothetical protein